MAASPLDGVIPWPDDFQRRYRGSGYWRGTPLGRALDASFARHRDRVSVVDGERRLTYGALGTLVDRLALHLAERGLHSGARVIFQLPNVLEFVVAYVACLKVGAIPVACLPAHRYAEVSYLARHTNATGWIVPAEHRGFDYLAMAEEVRDATPSLREIWVLGDRAARGMTRLGDLLGDPVEARSALGALERLVPAPDAPAVFQLSGGTTGLPKVIPRTHDDYLYNSLASAAAASVDADSVLLIGVPVAHNFPLACPGVQAALLLGARVVLAAAPDPDTVLPLIERERVTWIPAVPATVIGWLEHPRLRRTDLTSLRTLCVGGSRLNSEPARRVLDTLGPVLMQVFGMAEGLLCYTRTADPADVVIETQGRPVSPADEIRVVDETGRALPAGEIGELETRGPYTIRGYYRADAHNRTAFTADGFYRTGDLVRVHPSGNLVVEGRRKDLINRGGEKISAEEIENLIVAHPAVLNAAVIAIPDPVLGERACACVVLRAGGRLTLGELTRYLAEERRIAKFKLPERLEIYERLPATAVGKISKTALRDDIRRRIETEGPETS
jgi:2,3-dihydroxybenzoate-AMP ligase